jgi:hypothetical protein
MDGIRTNLEPFLPISEAARFLGASRAYLYCEAPNIEHFKINGGKFGRLLSGLRLSNASQRLTS